MSAEPCDWRDPGPISFDWTPEVRAVVHEVLNRWPQLTANTYECHPWRGWDRFSVDFWGPGGRGDPLRPEIARELRAFLHRRRGPPLLRHSILGHRLWTSFGGWSRWLFDDHSGNERHVHLTYWPH